METVNSIPFAGKTVTLSFYARAGANYSAASGALNYVLKSGTGTDQKHDVYTGGVDVINQTATLTTSWQRFSYSATVGTTATELAVLFATTPVGTAGANDYFEVTEVQLESASTATAFKRNASNIQGELSACQRYYWRVLGTNLNSAFANGFAISTTQAFFAVNNPVVMRSTPTAIEWSTTGVNLPGVGNVATTAMSIADSNPQVLTVGATVSSGLTQYRPYMLSSFASANGYIGFSAEL
jgi:hypothetical protein